MNFLVQQSINHNLYKKKLFSIAGREFDFISTIDHPFSSPPIRIIDGHQKILNKTKSGLRPLICIWDVNYPSNVRYRMELSLDSGIFCSKDDIFSIFSDRFLYSIQKPKSIDFSEFKKRFSLILLKKKNDKDLATDPRINIQSNLDKIVSLYEKNIKTSKTGTDFYINLLLDFYDLLNLKELETLFRCNNYPYFGSAVMCEWIAFCIQSSHYLSYDLYNLVNSGVFKQRCFRTLNVDHKNDINEGIDLYNREKLLKLLKTSSIVPSYEVFFWTLSLAGIKHFGNDYGFFNRLNDFYKSKKISCKILPIELQTSRYKEDSEDLIQLKRDAAFNCYIEKNNYVIKKNNNTKSSRINNLPAVYVYMGDKLSIVLRDILYNNTTKPFVLDN